MREQGIIGPGCDIGKRPSQGGVGGLPEATREQVVDEDIDNIVANMHHIRLQINVISILGLPLLLPNDAILMMRLMLFPSH
jgi:hypothetical protein